MKAISKDKTIVIRMLNDEVQSIVVPPELANFDVFVVQEFTVDADLPDYTLKDKDGEAVSFYQPKVHGISIATVEEINHLNSQRVI